jgi:hypothetical protein
MAKLRHTTMPALIQEPDPKKRCPYCGGTVDFMPFHHNDQPSTQDFLEGNYTKLICEAKLNYYALCQHCRRSGIAPTEDVQEVRWKT